MQRHGAEQGKIVARPYVVFNVPEEGVDVTVPVQTGSVTFRVAKDLEGGLTTQKVSHQGSPATPHLNRLGIEPVSSKGEAVWARFVTTPLRP